MKKHTNNIDVVPFEFEGQAVRVIDREGDPWFVAADVAKVLEIGRTDDAVRRLDEDEKGADTIRTPGGAQQVTIINESGLYSLILTSRKPAAKRFKKWVTAEVLPSIRMTGSYGTPTLADKLEDPAWLRMALLDYTDKVIALQADLDEAKPKVSAYERIAQGSDGAMCITNAAKHLQLRPKDLFAWLSQRKWIYKRVGSSRWIAYQDKIQAGYLEHKVAEVTRSDGSAKIVEQVLMTAKGVARLAHLLGADLVTE